MIRCSEHDTARGRRLAHRDRRGGLGKLALWWATVSLAVWPPRYGFAPQMALVFLFLSILEDCGYMARVAFIMDRVFRKFGLSGKSFIPFLISSGCGVPGIMASRTIENEKDRRMTMITTTCIPCGAKLPVIALIAGFLMGGAWWMAPLMYFSGIAVVIISCIVMKEIADFFGGTGALCHGTCGSHVPIPKGVLLVHVWERIWAFLKKAGTVIFCAAWQCGSSEASDFRTVEFGLVDTGSSFLAIIGSAIASRFAPLGFGTWQAVASTFSSFKKKESFPPWAFFPALAMSEAMRPPCMRNSPPSSPQASRRYPS